MPTDDTSATPADEGGVSTTDRTTEWVTFWRRGADDDDAATAQPPTQGEP